MKARYDAECWAKGKTHAEIKAEIARINKMWEMGRDFQFEPSAHYWYNRMSTLKELIKS